MRQLLFLSIISALVASGCGDDCGPGGAPAVGLIASSADVILTYGNLTSSPNHDCPETPEVEPLTIEGVQTDGDAPAIITLCLPRPDLLAKMDLPLATGIKIIDLRGAKDGCMFELESSRPALGRLHGVHLGYG